jgi:hypothetical protein
MGIVAPVTVFLDGGKAMTRLMLEGLLVPLFCFTSVSALAAETWGCSFAPTSGSARGLQGDAEIQIEANALSWRVLVVKAPLNPDAGAKREAFPYKLLENNSVGIVAVSSQSRMDEHVGPLVGATVVTIRKQSGELRMGSVMANGEHDLLSGHCELKKRN